jgi:hypothetical protein
LRGDIAVDARWEDAWIARANVSARIAALSFDELAFEDIEVNARSDGETADAAVNARPTGGKRVVAVAKIALHRTHGIDRKIAPIIDVHTEGFPLRYARRFLPSTVTLPDATIDLDAHTRAGAVEVELAAHVAKKRRVSLHARAAASLFPLIEQPFSTPLSLDIDVPREELATLLAEWGVAPPPVAAQTSARVHLEGTVYEPAASLDVALQAQGHDAAVHFDLAAGDESKLAGTIDVDKLRVLSLVARVGSNMKAVVAGQLPLGRPLALDARIEKTELGRLGSFDARLANITGHIEGLINARGTVDKPVLEAASAKKVTVGPSGATDVDFGLGKAR